MQGRLCESATSTTDFWTPAVLLSVHDVDFAPEHAQAALNDFAHRDDVFCDDFTSAVILQSSHGVVAGDLDAVASRLAQTHQFQTVFTGGPAASHGSLPQGPYFIHGKSIHQAWKLYDDDLDAFVVPTIPDDVSNPTTRSVCSCPGRCSCRLALMIASFVQFLGAPSGFAQGDIQEHRRAKSTLRRPEQGKATGWRSYQHQGQL